MSAIRDALIYLSLKYEGDFFRIYDALNAKEKLNIELYNHLRKNIKHKLVTMVDKNYPDYFKDKANPPVVLYYEGNMKLLDNDLPKEDFYTIDGSRAVSTVLPVQKEGKVMFDYVVVSDNQNTLENLVEHIKDKGLKLKNYDKRKSIER